MGKRKGEVGEVKWGERREENGKYEKERREDKELHNVL